MSSKLPGSPRPSETEARRAITAMLILTGVLAITVAIIPLNVTLKSLILVAWIAVMMGVLRRYRL